MHSLNLPADSATNAVPIVARKPMPAPGEPLTLGGQLAAIVLAIHLGEVNGTSAETEWSVAYERIRERELGR